MPIIPMRQIIQVSRDSSSELNRWGNPKAPKKFELKCRIDEGSNVVSSRTPGVVKGEEVVATARILIDKLADVKYQDVLSFTNELGETVQRKPKEINVRRNIGGKPILTEVIL